MLKEHDFVEIEYTGTLKEEKVIFDTTNPDIAKKHDIYNEKMTYEPVIVCIGEQQVLAGIDKQLPSMDVGQEKTFDVTPENGFGKKESELIQFIPLSKFKEHNIDPMPGLQVNIDGAVGLVKTIGGGKVMVDFNHPLAGKALNYTVKVKRKVESMDEKVQAYCKMTLPETKTTWDTTTNTVTIELPETLKSMPDEVKKQYEEHLKKILPEVKTIIFK